MLGLCALEIFDFYKPFKTKAWREFQTEGMSYDTDKH